MKENQPKIKNKRNIKRSFTKEQLKQMLQEAGVSVYKLEQVIGVKEGVFANIFKPSLNRELPVKYEADVLAFLKKAKAEKEDVKIIAKDVLIENGIDIPLEVPETVLPFLDERKAWIKKLQEAKAAVQEGI